MYSGKLPKPRIKVSKIKHLRWKCFSNYPFYVAGFGNTEEEAYYEWAWCFRETVNSLEQRD